MLKPRDSFAKEYHLKKCIDVKGLAEVWEVASVNNHIINSVALKIYPWVYTAGIKEIEAGFAKQPYFEHSNLLSAKRLGIYANRPFLEMHFCNDGNISKNILQLSEGEIVKCMHQVSSALAYLHENSIVHGCIKPSNILIDGNSYYLYLADLGLGHALRETIERFVEVDTNELIMQGNSVGVNKGLARTILPCFCAPELFEGIPQITSASDIWAFGASIFEMITGRLPFGYLGGEAQKKNNAILKDIHQSFSVDFNYILKKCLSKNKEDRPTAQEIEELTNDFLKGRKPPAFLENPAANVESVKPVADFATPKPDVELPKTVTVVELVKSTIEVEPAKPIIIVEPLRPANNIAPVKPVVFVEQPQTNINIETNGLLNEIINQNSSTTVEQTEPVVNIGSLKSVINTEEPKPIINIEPVKTAINIESLEPTTIIQPIIFNTTIAPINSEVVKAPMGNEGAEAIEPIKAFANTEPTHAIFTIAKESENPKTDEEPLKQIFFNTIKQGVVIKNVHKKDLVRWKTVLNFTVPSIVVGILLFAYIQLSSDSPEYKITPIPKYTIKPLPKSNTDTSAIIKKQPIKDSSKYITPNSKVVTTKPPISK